MFPNFFEEFVCTFEVSIVATYLLLEDTLKYQSNMYFDEYGGHLGHSEVSYVAKFVCLFA